MSGRDVIGRGLRTALDRVAFALALGETGRDPRIATGRGLRIATDRVDNARDPLLAVEVVVTANCHTTPLAAFVTACGQVRSLLPPLTARDQRRVDGEPDVRSRRVWRRLLSPRLLLSLRRLLQ